MKKKTKRLLSSSFAIPFWTAIIVCLFGAAISYSLFHKSFFGAVTKMNEEPIAVITFKYKTAQRKFLKTVVWNRLVQNSPVYNGDTIHTSSLSEATLHFSDGNVMELSENTMAQVFLNEDKTLSASLSSGIALIDSSDAIGGVTLQAGGVQVSIEAGSSLSAASSSVITDGDEISSPLSLQVLKGNATIGSTSLSEGQSVEVASDGTSSNAILVVNNPVPDVKYLNTENSAYKVPFSWVLENLAVSKDLILETSSDRNFSNIKHSLSLSGLNSVVVEFEEGLWYWRMRANSKEAETLKPVYGRIRILQSSAPKLVVPISNYHYYYRTKKPSVRLIWEESPYATSYELLIAQNPDFGEPVIRQRSSLTSSIISTLSAGTYYWKVTPFYTVNKIGYTASSEVQTFSILHKDELLEPVPLTPVDNGSFNIENSSSLNFSWKMEDEADFYNIVISKNEDLSQPLVNKNVKNNYFILDYRIPDGTYYWAVSQTDSEGNVSKQSALRKFYAMSGEPKQHTIQPLDGFRVAQSLISDTVFSWKRNLPEIFQTYFEVASDSSFENIVFTESITRENHKGLNLGIGTYWWRLKSINSTNGTALITASKSFSVMGPLAAASLIAPATKAVARENFPFEFKWTDIPEADYYKFCILKNGEIVYDDNVYAASTKVDLYSDNFIDKSVYSWTVQAQAQAIENVSSRRSGRIADGTFYLVKLRPVKILHPEKNQKIIGLEAVRNPGVIEWFTEEEDRNLRQAQLVVSKRNNDTGREEIVLKSPSDEEFANGVKIAKRVVRLPKLRAGDYTVKVLAITNDGIDISNTEAKHLGIFKVLPTEPLPDITGLSVSPSAFNLDYLSNPDNPRVITIRWNAVENADDYFVTLFQKKGRRMEKILEKNVLNTEYEIDFIKIIMEGNMSFSNGNYIISVIAVVRDEDKDRSIIQESPAAKADLLLDVPDTGKTKLTGAKNAYGK